MWAYYLILYTQLNLIVYIPLYFNRSFYYDKNLLTSKVLRLDSAAFLASSCSKCASSVWPQMFTHFHVDNSNSASFSELATNKTKLENQCLQWPREKTAHHIDVICLIHLFVHIFIPPSFSTSRQELPFKFPSLAPCLTLPHLPV